MTHRVLLCSLLVVSSVYLCACDHKAPPASPSHSATQAASQPTTRSLRIAALSPAAAVIVRDLGFESALVARHAFDAASSQTLAVAGDQAGIDYEALIAQSPSHVITQWGARELPARLKELTRTSAWQHIDVNPISLEDIHRCVFELDAFLQKSAQAATPSPRAHELATQLGAISAASSDPQTQRTFTAVLLLSTSPIAALGPTSCQAQVAQAAGFSVLPANAGAYTELSSEELLKLSPDCLIIFSPSVNASQSQDDLAALRTRTLAPLASIKLHTRPTLLITSTESLLPSTSMLRLHQELTTWRATLSPTTDTPRPQPN